MPWDARIKKNVVVKALAARFVDPIMHFRHQQPWDSHPVSPFDLAQGQRYDVTSLRSDCFPALAALIPILFRQFPAAF